MEILKGILMYAGGLFFFLIVLPKVIDFFFMRNTNEYYNQLYNESIEWVMQK